MCPVPPLCSRPAPSLSLAASVFRWMWDCEMRQRLLYTRCHLHSSSVPPTYKLFTPGIAFKIQWHITQHIRTSLSILLADLHVHFRSSWDRNQDTKKWQEWRYFSGSDQLCGESVSLLILFLCLGFANIVFCKDGEPPVGVLHKEASFTSSNRRCWSK